jgi:hypothetical protein
LSNSQFNILTEGHMDNTTLFSRFAAAIRTTDFASITNTADIPETFLLGRTDTLAAHYISFDTVNRAARVVLVGITPGFTQWKNAMKEAQRQLQAGASPEDAVLAAKNTGAFSGAMRPNLINLLDAIGLPRWLGISSCDTLFGAQASLVQTTSILRHPIFVNGDNYNGTPNMIRTPFLQQQMLEHFARESAQLANPVYIPLGPKVNEGLRWLVSQGVLKADQILDGLPHPSGANAERIAYFLGRKDRSALSAKTNAAQLDASRDALLARVLKLT